MSRMERDSMGRVEVPDLAYYGPQTARAIANFPISGHRERQELVQAYAAIKRAAAKANMALGGLDRIKGEAIIAAATEVFEGRFLDQFPVDIFQAGGGTSFNMNLNEVIASRALEMLGRERGDVSYLGPNDHVNMSQSSNDTFPTAAHIAAIWTMGRLAVEVEELIRSLTALSREHEDVAKAGRTHLVDALPVTLGSEFAAYAASLERARVRLGQRRSDLLELPIGGTAVGTGVNAPLNFKQAVIAQLSEDLGLAFLPCLDGQEGLQSRAQLGAASGAMRELAVELLRITNDLRLLASGPGTAIGEIVLPPVQPGSSMMAGKINPSIPEAVAMVCFHVIGLDAAVMMACQAGQLELNVFAPIIGAEVVEMAIILSNGAAVLRTRCVEGIRADEQRCCDLLRHDAILTTLLVPRIGHLRTAEVEREVAVSGDAIEEVVARMGIMSLEDARIFFDPLKAARRFGLS